MDEITEVLVLSPSEVIGGVFPGQKITSVTIERIGPAGGPGADGAEGAPGQSGVGVFVSDEIPVGAIDGVNVDYTTANVFFHLMVYLNGLRLKVGLDFIITGPSAFQMFDAPLPGDKLTVDYLL